MLTQGRVTCKRMNRVNVQDVMGSNTKKRDIAGSVPIRSDLLLKMLQRGLNLILKRQMDAGYTKERKIRFGDMDSLSYTANFFAPIVILMSCMLGRLKMDYAFVIHATIAYVLILHIFGLGLRKKTSLMPFGRVGCCVEYGIRWLDSLKKK